MNQLPKKNENRAQEQKMVLRYHIVNQFKQRMFDVFVIILFMDGVGAFGNAQVSFIDQRQALLDKSKELNPPSSPFTSSGWSNRPATVLTPITVDGVYSADRPFIWNKIDVGGRMAVIEMPTSTDGKRDLWVHSPVELDEPLKEALSKLGTVKYVVSPNYEHLKYAAQWHESFPDAEMWGCPGLKVRFPLLY